ncbi:dihydrolipoyl dehydrogenase family protein [Roseimaritima sediminicola]|uniref:dihydrolipoyl dehydrogenase family protein n=1 Tax=Roseimaritima sediminicola TaxID=2662066 RepID=UPI0012983BD2|nr:NAD(P)/FAD-dependent oxidoreductase [Roseimaritima sediminicola]
MSEAAFDLIVLGSGPSGGSIATGAAEQGKRVAVVETRQVGGTCALRGCNPKKVYTNAGAILDTARRSRGSLLGQADVAIDWRSLHDFKRQFTDPVPEGKREDFANHGIELIKGSSRFVDEQSIDVDGRVLKFERLVIATGAVPRPLDIPGEDLVTHSDDFLDLQDLPPCVTFIGGGYVSMEFAHVVARSGRRVVVAERGQRVLDGFDPDLVRLLQDYSQRCGIEFRFNREAKEVEGADGCVRQLVLDDGERIDCQLVVHGAGRIPNLESLNLEAGNVKRCKRGVVVNKYLQSESNPRVFATGDCAASDEPKLTPVANEEARAVGNNLWSDQPDCAPQYGAVPSVAFTTPSIASVGLSAEQAEQDHGDVDIRCEEISQWGSVRKVGGPVAGYKVILDKSNRRVLGAHLLGPGAEETINLFALAMRYGLDADQIKSTLFAFPTFASDVRQML